jgi:hypothetical protein
MTKKKKPKRQSSNVAKLTAQIEKLKRDLAKYKPAYDNPQTGHGRPLSEAEMRFVAIMRKTKPRYCLPEQQQHPSLKAWAAVPTYVGDGWTPAVSPGYRVKHLNLSGEPV